jgi:hypothetical protein
MLCFAVYDRRTKNAIPDVYEIGASKKVQPASPEIGSKSKHTTVHDKQKKAIIVFRMQPGRQ